MNNSTKYIGTDVPKEKIVAVADGDSRESSRYWGEIANHFEDARKSIRVLGGKAEQSEVCYEAGPTGYILRR